MERFILSHFPALHEITTNRWLHMKGQKVKEGIHRLICSAVTTKDLEGPMLI